MRFWVPKHWGTELLAWSLPGYEGELELQPGTEGQWPVQSSGPGRIDIDLFLDLGKRHRYNYHSPHTRRLWARYAVVGPMALLISMAAVAALATVGTGGNAVIRKDADLHTVKARLVAAVLEGEAGDCRDAAHCTSTGPADPTAALRDAKALTVAGSWGDVNYSDTTRTGRVRPTVFGTRCCDQFGALGVGGARRGARGQGGAVAGELGVVQRSVRTATLVPRPVPRVTSSHCRHTLLSSPTARPRSAAVRHSCQCTCAP